MALLSREEIVSALERLGQLAVADGHTVRLIVVGGAAMVLGYDARASTKDVDVMILSPPERDVVRGWARIVAQERGWDDDWLNDAAKGYLIGLSTGALLLQSPGIEASRPAVEQLLAMKLSAWRDDVDIADARLLLGELHGGRSHDEIWRRIVPYLVPGRQLKAQYAFEDLWESVHGNG